MMLISIRNLKRWRNICGIEFGQIVSSLITLCRGVCVLTVAYGEAYVIKGFEKNSTNK